MPSRPNAVSLVSIVLLSALLGACSNDASPSSSATTTATASPEGTSTAANAELCAQRDALKSSLQDVRNVDIAASGPSGLEAAVTKVRTNLQALGANEKDEYREPAQALEVALEQLDTAVKNVDSGGVDAVVTATGNVLTSGDALLQSLQSLKCN